MCDAAAFCFCECLASLLLFRTVLILLALQDSPDLCCNGGADQRRGGLELFSEIFIFCSKSQLEVITQSEEMEMTLPVECPTFGCYTV